MSRRLHFSKRPDGRFWHRSREKSPLRREHASQAEGEISHAVVRTVQEEGWAGFKNGDLLRRASGKFDVLLTADQRLRYQQTIDQFAIRVVAIETFDTTLAGVRPLLPQINHAIASIVPGTVLVVRTA